MPELPEVQTIINDLQEIVGDQFTGFFSHVPKALKNIPVSKFTQEIKNEKIRSITRLGKFILINLTNEKSITIHLKMTGQLLLMGHETRNIKPKTSKHFHHEFFLKKNGLLVFSDVRKFGTISLLSKEVIEKIKAGYGPDPIAENFLKKDLISILKKRKNKQIKLVLMDNSAILGIGNIYASEILFEAKILPNRIAGSLSKEEISKLHHSITKILRKAILLRGTSASDYLDARGQKGSFQKVLNVYKKNGQNCKVCGTIIRKSIIGQRSSFFCSKCQK